MELELGLKITKTVGDLRSTDLRIAKDQGGNLFLSRETETMFILIAHLKGYRTENIKININEDGTLISIRGEKTIQETVMKGWMLFKNEPEVIGFKKTFRIPKGINLDGINAKYIDDESTTLTISMPKLSKGIAGARIEELLEDKDDQQDSAAAAGDGNDGDQVGARKEREWHEAETSSKGGGEGEEVMENAEEVNNDIDDDDDDDDDDDEKGVWKRIAPCFFMGSALILMVVGFVKSKKPCFCA